MWQNNKAVVVDFLLILRKPDEILSPSPNLYSFLDLSFFSLSFLFDRLSRVFPDMTSGGKK